MATCCTSFFPPILDPASTAAICRGGAVTIAGSAGAVPRGPFGKRETEVLNLLVCGSRSHEIATALGMRASTVASHLQNLRGKLGARSTPELIAIAARLGLVA